MKNIAIDISAHDVCHALLYQLRLSNLHFGISETPYSVQILLRKRFLREATGPATSFSRNFTYHQEVENFEHQKNLASTENDSLRKQIEELESIVKSSKQTTELLEDKIAKVEASAFKSYSENNIKVTTLKN